MRYLCPHCKLIEVFYDEELNEYYCKICHDWFNSMEVILFEETDMEHL